ncbi:HAD-IC family P-type ATPase [Acidisphaera sp. L21]|uniref:HAD-IC family P-type ATPase n=1 Tax=Acidisphaera sp. L21 TaxID=1641851 RepID=UPI00131E1D34|nr:HAD-IC family P-type ATPase [Acidisphaera sp. L21]
MPILSLAETKPTPVLQSATGLTEAEATRRLAQFGTNTMPDTVARPWRRAVGKFWAPVPWMLEAAIALELGLGKYFEASVIFGLLLFNSIIGLVQEGRAQQTLKALKSSLAMNAFVLRDGQWRVLQAARLVPGDTVKLSLGGVVAADADISDGQVLVDQSMLTGESVPIQANAGTRVYAGSLIRRGEAMAVVSTTGSHTKFGRTAELVVAAHVTSSQQTAVVKVVRNLMGFAGCAIVVMAIYASILHLPFSAILPLVLTAVLGSIPVALPATFTLAAAIGAKALAKVGVLPTRLSAVDEAGTMTLLCVDKTGTLTQNQLAVADVEAMPGFAAAQVLALAALASSEGGPDPVDSAIRTAAGKPSPGAPRLLKFTPFDPAMKTAEALFSDQSGAECHVVKGAFAAVIRLCGAQSVGADRADSLEHQGFRVLAVATGQGSALQLAGLIALSDPPRPDSAPLVQALRDLGIQTVMVTGDAAKTAVIVAEAVGLPGSVCPASAFPKQLQANTFGIFAGVTPEDKYDLVKLFQAAGEIVGMCGDGANDAPPLRQAHIGIAVSTATDIAKSAAGMVLTAPGLSGVIDAVRQGRITFQRIQTYTINSITKKIVTVFFLIAGLVMTGHAVLTPLLMVIIMIAGDFLAMSLTTDHVRASSKPNAWKIGNLTIAGTALGVCLLAFGCGVLAFGTFVLRLPLTALQTLSFITLVFGSQAMIYAIRGRPRLWSLRPSLALAISSVVDIAAASILAVTGIAMAPLSAVLVVGVLGAACGLALCLDLLKHSVFARLGVD